MKETLQAQQILEQIAETYPNHPAIKQGDVICTHQMLNKKANQLARVLQSKISGRQKRIAVYIQPSINLATILIAISKLRHVYLILDPNYPQTRLEEIVEDADPDALIASNHYLEQASLLFDGAISIEDLVQLAHVEEDTNLVLTPQPEEIAYIVYTSGSMGKPKGIEIGQLGLDKFLREKGKAIGFDETMLALHVMSLGFDGFIWELLGILSHGGCIKFHPNPEMDVISQLAQSHDDVTYLGMPPSVAAMVNSENFKNLKKLMLAGEKIQRSTLEKWLQHVAVYNAYGPSETTISVTLFECRLDKPANTIGKPLDSVNIVIVDESENLLPTGVVGEMYIGGDYVAKGYLNHPELTPARFVTLSGFPGIKFYKTGDFARYLSDGNLEIIGRIDDQVKVRGHRIELGEIESCIIEHQDVKQTSVQVIETSTDKFIVAFLVGKRPMNDNENAKIEEQLVSQLQVKLPEYMLPRRYYFLTEIPLTANGKTDKKALLKDIEVKIDTKAALQVSQAESTYEKLAVIIKDLLNIDCVSPNDDFYHIGGHSLLLLQLVYKINEIFQISLKASEFFGKTKLSSISGLVSEFINKQDQEPSYQLPALNQSTDINNDPFPLTEVQQAYWLGRNPAFDLSAVAVHGYFEFDCGELDIERLEQAWNLVINAHDALRTIILPDGQQQVLTAVEYNKIKTIDLRNQSHEEIEKNRLSLRQKMSNQVFDAGIWPLFEFVCVKTDSHTQLFLSIDGLMLDAWSARLIFNQWGKLYHNLDYKIPQTEIRFKDYVLYTQDLQQSDIFHSHEAYWLAKLDEFPSAPQLPVMLNSVNQKVHDKFLRLAKHVDKQGWEKIKSFANRLSITPTSLLLALFTEVLFYWSNQSHFALTLTLFNRLPVHQHINAVAGDFTSLILFDIDMLQHLDMPFTERAKSVHAHLWNNLDHRLYGGIPFLRKLASKRGCKVSDVSPPIVFTALLGEDEDMSLPEFMQNERFSITQTPQVWLDFKAYHKKGKLVFDWDFLEGIFPENVIEDMFEGFLSGIESIIECEDEKRYVLPNFIPKRQVIRNKATNKTDKVNKDKLLHELFFDAAKLHPENVALVYKKQEITYKSLDYLSRALACIIDERRTQTAELVGILLPKSWYQVWASLGILAGGGVYIPIDVTLPEKRREYLLEQNNIRLIVTLSEYAFNDNCISLDTLEQQTSTDIAIELPRLNVTSSDLAYVILTSGTTGVPKGVMIEHQGAVNTIFDINERFKVTEKDVVLALSNLSFDLSVYDIFGLLAVGGKIVIPQECEKRVPGKWVEYCQEYDVSVWNTVPMFMQLLIEHLRETVDYNYPCPSLRLILMSGDKIPVTLPGQIQKTIGAIADNLQVISLGGATEGSIWSIIHEINIKSVSELERIPYGKPMVNQRFYVLNQALTPCPDYVVGELYIGGKGVARGYLNDPELSNYKFFYHAELNDRVYRTGDIGRYLTDGNIEILGRCDAQVKVQGHRVELGEIEAYMAQYPEVQEAVVYLPSSDSQYKGLLSCIKTDDPIKPESVLALQQKKIETTVSDWSGYDISPYVRKSYRQFVQESVLQEHIKSVLKCDAFSAHQVMRNGEIGDIMARIKHWLYIASADTSQDNAIEKYNYPSAGNLYPVQLFIQIPSQNGDKISTLYKYCPLKRELQPSSYSIPSDCQGEKQNYLLYFVSAMQTIESKYEHLANRFIRLEMGHILALLDEYASHNGLSVSSLNLIDFVSLENDAFLTGVVSVQDQSGITLKSEMEQNCKAVYYFSKKNEQCSWYQYSFSNATFSYLGENQVATKYVQNYNYAIINDSTCGFIFARGSSAALENHEDEIAIGYISQLLLNEGINHARAIGFCPIGSLDAVFAERSKPVFTDNDFVYGLIGGYVAPCQVSEKSYSLAREKTVVISENITRYCQAYLPEYMIPKKVYVVDKLPLSSNGKVDRGLLPQPSLDQANSHQYVAAETDVEKRLCKIWQEVLGQKQIGVTDNFFHLGGHSLHILQICNQIRKHMNYELSIMDAFELTTPIEMSKFIQSHASKLKDIKANKIRKDSLPCTHQQRRLWFLDHILIIKHVYNIPIIICYEGELNVQAVSKSLNTVVSNHEAFRTAFLAVDGQPYQKIVEAEGIKLELQSIQSQIQEKDGQLERLFAFINEPFDLSVYPLLRAANVCFANTKYLVFSLHHIIADAWSIQLFLEEFMALYKGYISTSSTLLKKQELHYSDYAIWQKSELAPDSPAYQKQVGFWMDYLEGAPSKLFLPTDYHRPEQEQNTGKTLAFVLEPLICTQLKNIARSLNATLFTTLLSAFHVLLSKYANQDDTVVGYPVSNRSHAGIENSIGYYANTLISRISCSEDLTFAEVVTKLKRDIVKAQDNQNVPFEALIDELGIERQLSYHPIFQVLFVMQDDRYELPTLEGINSQYLTPPLGTAKFDLQLSVIPNDRGYVFEFEYAASLFAKETIQNFGKCYINVLKSILENSSCKLKDIHYLSDSQLLSLNQKVNNTDENYPCDVNILQLINLADSAVADQIGLTYLRRHYNYAQLEKKANQLANYLIGCGVKKGDRIPVIVERSDWAIIAILAILKVGASYVPIEVQNPKGRIHYILGEIQAKHILTTSNTKSLTDIEAGICVQLDTDWIHIADASFESPKVIVSANSIAYILYTSGSSGRPKGVEVQHKSLVNRIYWMKKALNIDSTDCILQKTSLGFDVAGWEIFLPLLAKARMVIAKDGLQQDPDALYELVSKEQVTTLHFVPSMLEHFVNKAVCSTLTLKLKHIISSGEALSLALSNRAQAVLQANLYNFYGPTETTIDSTYWQCKTLDKSQRLPIGKPIANTQIYIIDSHQHILPQGMLGEIAIGGDGVAKSYFNNPTQTSEKFISHPDISSNRVYLTGDLGRLNANYELEYWGRADTQVKLYGQRIELCEIERVLEEHEYVSKAKVILKSIEQGMHLLAFVETTQPVSQESSIKTSIMHHLSMWLPGYMIPKQLVVVATFPYLTNGKLDMQALSDITVRKNETTETTEDVFNHPVVAEICKLFCQVFNIASIAPDESFFQRGADSITSIQFVAMMKKNAYQVQVVDVFKYPTPRLLAKYLTQYETKQSMNQTEREVFDASTLQKGMIYYSSIDDRQATYQDIFSYQIQDTLDVVLFTQSIEQVCQIHPILQAAFTGLETSSPKIVVYQKVRPPIQVLDKTTMEPILQESYIREWMALEHQNKINIMRPPLIRFALHKFAHNRYHFGFTFHHAILDGWSVASLFVEIYACYQALKNERPYMPVPFKSTFRSYVEHERKVLEDNHQKVFWQENLRGYIPSKRTLLPVELKNDETKLSGVVNHHSPINQNEFDQLKKVAIKLNVPIRTILLSVHMAVLSYFLNSKDIVSGYVASTRLEEEDAQYAKGLFLNTLPFRLKIENAITWSNFIRSVYASELDIMAHRFYPLAQIQQDNGYEQLIDIVFSFVQFHIYDGLHAHEADGFVKLEVFEKTNFDLMVNFYGGHAAKSPHFDIDYNPAKYSVTMIKSLADCYQQAMQNLIFGLDEGIFVTPYLKRQNLKLDSDSLRKSETLIPTFESVIEMIIETAKLYSSHTAIETDEQKISYLGLYNKVSAIANHLVLQGVRQNQPIVLYGSRSIDSIASILAIMLLGAIYVPIDVCTPQGRVDKIVGQLTDFKVLTTKRHCDTFEEYADSLVFLDEVPCGSNSHANMDSQAKLSDTAYILFTSGTTGDPKGVRIDHRALLLRSMWFIQHFALTYDDKYAHYTSYSFDVSLEEVLIPLISGATLYVMPDSIAYNPVDFMEIVNDVNITFIETVPTFLLSLLRHNAFSNPSKLRHVIVGGESLDVALVHDFYQQCDIPLWNLYGPTETTINASYFDCREITMTNSKVVPIGKPIANTNIFLLNADKQPIIDGTIGEIYISGDGVAQGYLNLDGPNNSFINLTPYSLQVKPIRSYQTGDLGRLLPCGNIEFLGRVDSQVKHNGIRIELDEIEACIKQVEGVDMVVVKQEHIDEKQYLVAYLKMHNTLQDSEHQYFLKRLQEIVAIDIPRQVIPSYYAILDTMPLLPSLKINKQALTHQNYPLNPVITDRVLPRNQMEEKLAGIWLSLLGVNTISVYDNFFSLGGTSFDVTQLLYLVKQEFDDLVDTQAFLKRPTIASLAKTLVKTETELSTDSPQFSKDLLNIQSMCLDSSILSQPVVTNSSYILLTGATGYIGSYLLQELLVQTNAIIYCLVRLEDMTLALQQLVDALPGTVTRDQTSRIVPVNGDLAKPKFGMATDVYARLLSRVDRVYHAAAKVNHLLDYAQLRVVNYLGSLEILKFATTERNKKIVYLSSLSAVAFQSSRIPEAFVPLNPSNIHGGYNQSKWMSEAMFTKSASLGAMLSIYRLGSIIGDTKSGSWRQSDNHFLSLIAGCIQLGVAPDWPFTFDLLPVNKIAQFIVKASLSAEESELINVGASCPALWIKIIEALQTDYSIRIISQKEWLDHYLPQVDETNPIYPLLAFYQNEFKYDETCDMQFDITQFQAKSKTLGIEKIEISINEFKTLVLAALATQTSPDITILG